MSPDNGTIKRRGSEHNTFPKNQRAEHFDSSEWGENKVKESDNDHIADVKGKGGDEEFLFFGGREGERTTSV